MSDRTFEGYLDEANSIIRELNNIARLVEESAKGVEANKCADSLRGIANSCGSKYRKVNSAYREDLASKNKE